MHAQYAVRTTGLCHDAFNKTVTQCYDREQAEIIAQSFLWHKVPFIPRHSKNGGKGI